MNTKRKIIGEALAELVEQARTGIPKMRVGLMAAGSELGTEELLRGGALAMEQDGRLQVVAIGAKIPGYDCIEWIEVPDRETEITAEMELALRDHRISGAVALHYPFPLGVTTIGRVVTPARGKPLLIASCTGMSAASRTEAMLLNSIYGIAVAKALGLENPTLGILNVDGAAVVHRALLRLSERGYSIHFARSIRTDGGSLLRGNDLLVGSADICVCDSLTGNVLVKLFSAFNTGGSFEALGWGYGPSVGENWDRVVSIVSRASGAPVIANALCYTASLIRGRLVECVQKEVAAAKAAGLDEVIASMSSTGSGTVEVIPPPYQPTDSEIQGVDVLSIEVAVKELWRVGIYAESAMGCTGPVLRVPSSLLEKSKDVLRKTGCL